MWLNTSKNGYGRSWRGLSNHLMRVRSSLDCHGLSHEHKTILATHTCSSIYPISGLQFPDTVECWISLLCDFQVSGFPNFRMISNLLSLRLNSFILACISMFDCYILFLHYISSICPVCVLLQPLLGFPGTPEPNTPRIWRWNSMVFR